MPKIPTGNAISFGYLFCFGQFGTVLRAAGTPALVIAISDYISRTYEASQPAPPPGSPRSVDVILVSLLAGTFLFFAMSTAAVAITREVFEQAGTPSRQSFAVCVMRLAGAYVRYYFSMVVVLASALLACLIVFSFAGVMPEKGVPLQNVPLFLALLFPSAGLLLYIFVLIIRTGFFLPAIVVAEPKGGLLRSYALTQGNTLSAIAVSVALSMPMVLLAVLALLTLGDAPSGGDLESSGSAGRGLQETLILYEAMGAVNFLLFAGLGYSGVAYAYVSVTREDAQVSAV